MLWLDCGSSERFCNEIFRAFVAFLPHPLSRCSSVVQRFHSPQGYIQARLSTGAAALRAAAWRTSPDFILLIVSLDLDLVAQRTSSCTMPCAAQPEVANSRDRKIRLAHARTNRHSRFSHTWWQRLGLPGRSARRLQHTTAHEQLKTGPFRAGKGPSEPLTCDLTEAHPRGMAQHPTHPRSGYRR